MSKHKKHKLIRIITSAILVLVGVCFLTTGQAWAADPIKTGVLEPGAGKYTCGSGNDEVKVSINFGCKGQGNAVTDASFAVIRVLTAGVGLAIIFSFVLAGVEYTTSRGDPNGTAKAIGRIRNAFFALMIYIFSAAFLNFVLPSGFFK